MRAAYIGVLCAVKGVEAEVARGTVAALEHLNDGNETEKLEEADPHQQLLHGALLDSGIVEGRHLGVTCVARISFNHHATSCTNTFYTVHIASCAYCAGARVEHPAVFIERSVGLRIRKICRLCAQTRTENGLDTRELVHVLHDHASGGKHAHTAVLELSLAEPPDVDEVADAEGVEANVARLCFHFRNMSAGPGARVLCHADKYT
jgi:hypothetical protein